MTPCDRKHEDILDFEDGELHGSQKGEVKRHLDECCDCKKLLRQIRLQRAALKRCASLKTDDKFFLLLQERIRRELAGKRRADYAPAFGSRRWIPASAFAMVLLIAAGWMLTRKNAPGPAADGALPPKVGNAAALASKPVPSRVHYVIEDYPRARPAATSNRDTLVQMATADTALRVRDFESLKGRLTPVSF
jgi:anti-sigma factor RsiW